MRNFLQQKARLIGILFLAGVMGFVLLMYAITMNQHQSCNNTHDIGLINLI